MKGRISTLMKYVKFNKKAQANYGRNTYSTFTSSCKVRYVSHVFLPSMICNS